MPAEVRRVLQALRKQQAADKLARGPGYGCALENCGPAGLVFSNRHGRPANDDAVRRSFKLRCDWAGIGTDWQPREGRHTFASVLSDSGQDIEHISDAMGHANSIITRRVYRHQISDMINEVALVMDQVFPPGSVGGQDGG
jgi:integrase